MNYKSLNIILMFFLASFIVSSAQNNSVEPENLGFIRPGQMMDIPTSESYRSPYLFRVGISAEMIQFDPETLWRRGIFFESDITPKIRFNTSIVQPPVSIPDTLTKTQFGFHFQYLITKFHDFSISCGIQDFVVEVVASEDQASRNTTGFREMAPFLVISQINRFEDYFIHSYLGLGGGRFSHDLQGELESGSSTGSPIGLFAGFLLRTKSARSQKVWDFIAEYDGGGINIGAKIPILNNFSCSAGFVNVENLPQWGREEFSQQESPALVVGFSVDFPRPNRTAKERNLPESPLVSGVFTERDSVSLGKTKTPSFESIGQISVLRDSVLWYKNEVFNLQNSVAKHRKQLDVYIDSIRTIRLSRFNYEKNLNRAMRYLYESLQHYQAKDYSRSLEFTNRAIDLNPNLALAYARRGSIYYRTGDVGRATLNWQIALRIDPEFTSVKTSLTQIRNQMNQKKLNPGDK